MDFNSDIEKCLPVLRRGGLILYPTDTIWGIGCDATSEEAVEKVYAVKERPINKSFIILIAEERDLLKYVANPDLRVFDYLHHQQKPTTIIYENAIGLASNLLSEDGSIAIRIVKNEFCKNLIKRFRKPLVSTSANLSGKPSPGNFSEISPEIKTGVDYIVRYRQDDATPASSSTLAKWNANGTPSILRE